MSGGIKPELLALLPELLKQQDAQGLSAEDYLWGAAIQFAHTAWRNTVVEDWHAQSWGLSDGEMMRTNSATVKEIRAKLVEGESWSAIADALTLPTRTLPDGRTLKEYAGTGRVRVLRRETKGVGRVQDVMDEQLGRETTIRLVSVGMYGTGWHGSSQWPAIVERFCAAIDDPTHPHWDLWKQKGWTLPPRPPEIADTQELKRLLLEGPDLLTAAAAEWCISAQLTYIGTGN